MKKFKYPIDERFRKIAAKIADHVTIARSLGLVVSTSAGCLCPMGCLDTVAKPVFIPDRLAIIGMKMDEFWCFVSGFESDDPDVHKRLKGNPLHALGLEYRERFP